MANDEELMRENYLRSSKEDRDQPWSPQVNEMTAEMRALSMIYDRLGDVAQAVLSTIPVDKGKASPKYKGKPFPPPDSILERIKEQESRETGVWLVGAFMPHAAHSWESN